MTDRYIKVQDLAQMIGVSRATIYNWLNRGQLPHGRKIGGVRRWALSEIQAFLNKEDEHATHQH